MKHRSNKNGSANDPWETPQCVYDYLEEKYFTKKYFDPCPLHADFDGLEIGWQDENYINPPHG